jgi:hypothetical protein
MLDECLSPALQQVMKEAYQAAILRQVIMQFVAQYINILLENQKLWSTIQGKQRIPIIYKLIIDILYGNVIIMIFRGCRLIGFASRWCGSSEHRECGRSHSRGWQVADCVFLQVRGNLLAQGRRCSRPLVTVCN